MAMKRNEEERESVGRVRTWSMEGMWPHVERKDK
jgi:hypothetical protein